MKNKIISLILNLILFSLISFQINASEQAWNLAQEGDKIILIRHSLAPGGGDPPGFKIDDCKTQRNLNRKGINQMRPRSPSLDKVRRRASLHQPHSSHPSTGAS